MSETTEQPGKKGDKAESAETDNAREPERVAVRDLDVERAVDDNRRVVPKRALESLSVTVAVEIGRLDMRIRDITDLHQGEIISLDRAVEEPIDIRVNGALLARGEIVALRNKQYGVRVTEIVTGEQDALQE